MSVPKLRFKDDGQDFPEWEVSTIGERVTEKSSKFNPEKQAGNFNCIELEHLSQGTGELLGYVDVTKSKSIKNKFETGDVLFGKLRPYLRKFLKAPFSGVCSTEIWVLNGKGKEISNDFLFQFVKQKAALYTPGVNGGSFFNQSTALVDAWQTAGDEAFYQLYSSGASSAAATAFSRFSDSNAMIVDGSYLRLKNIAISYDLPLKVKGVNCKISLQGQNVLTFTPYRGGDPEFRYTGFLPPLRVFTGGVQLNF